MEKKYRIQIYLLFVWLIFDSCSTQNSADLILITPSYTVNERQPWAEAVAIKNNKIVFVGTKNEAMFWKGSSTRLMNNPDGMLLPGFIDTHVHLLTGGIEMSQCYLNDLGSPEEIFETIKNYISKNPDDKWIRGGGWLLPIFPDGNPLKEWLDDISSDKPIFLYSADVHSAWVNSKALELAGINSQTKDPPGGVIERYPNTKEPSGVLRESAMDLVASLLPKIKKIEIQKGLDVSIKEASRFGITTMLDAGTDTYPPNYSLHSDYDGLDAYREFSNNKDASIRVAASQYAHPTLWREHLPIIKKRKYDNDFGSMNIIKFFIDGVIEGGTAAMIEPYLGTNNYGIMNWSSDTLNAAFYEYEKAGFQIHAHAIGDFGIRTTLDAFEYARSKNKSTDQRHMICHTQLVHPDDIIRFRDLGVLASFQALWAYPDKYIKDLTIPRLGQPRSEWIYPINSIKKAGGRITGGSDWTVSSLNPLVAMEVAITRKEPGQKDGESLIPEEAVTLETILEAYTLEAAYGLFLDEKIGSIEVGKLADIVVLDRNLFKIPKHEIHSVKVNQTIFNGKIVYEKD